MIYLDLLIGFLKVGCFSFGGAYAAIPLIRDVVLSYGWLSDEVVTDMIAVSESTPGPIMVNLATYVGSSQGGLPGAIIATAAVVTPSFIIILLVMKVLRDALKNTYVQVIMQGLKACVAGIILAVGCYLVYTNGIAPLTQSGAGPFPLLITGILAILYYGSGRVLGKRISPIGLILVSACLGVVVYGV